MPETDYGPWHVVSCQRGRARGHGGVSRDTHVSARTTAETNDPFADSRGTVSHGIRSGHRGNGRGRFFVPHAEHSILNSDNLTHQAIIPQPINPTVETFEAIPTLIKK